MGGGSPKTGLAPPFFASDVDSALCPFFLFLGLFIFSLPFPHSAIVFLLFPLFLLSLLHFCPFEKGEEENEEEEEKEKRGGFCAPSVTWSESGY